MDLETTEQSRNGSAPPRKKAKRIRENDPTKRDLASLPREVLLTIFKYLDMKSVNNCATLCSTLYDISRDSSLYKSVSLKYKMNINFIKSLVEKCSTPREVYIEYKYLNDVDDTIGDPEDYTEFSEYVQIFLRKCGEYIKQLKIESCHDDETLACITDCLNLKELALYRCKGSFSMLPLLTNLTHINFVMCIFPSKVVSELVKHNAQLKTLNLCYNANVNSNEICDILSRCNPNIEELELSEKKLVKSKQFKTLARLTKLKKLELLSGPGCDSDPDPDALQQLAAGCPNLEKLAIYGRKEINDDNLIPALHMFTQLRHLDLRGVNITIKSCREAALSLPLLKTLDVFKCNRIKKAQLSQLKEDFTEIDIPLD